MEFLVKGVLLFPAFVTALTFAAPAAEVLLVPVETKLVLTQLLLELVEACPEDVLLFPAFCIVLPFAAAVAAGIVDAPAVAEFESTQLLLEQAESLPEEFFPVFRPLVIFAAASSRMVSCSIASKITDSVYSSV